MFLAIMSLLIHHIISHKQSKDETNSLYSKSMRKDHHKEHQKNIISYMSWKALKVLKKERS